MPTTASPLTLLPSADAAAARLQRLAGLARLVLPGWAERLPAGAPASAEDGAPTLCVDSLAGRFWLRLDAGFDALRACATLPQRAQRDAVATLLAAEALRRWLPGLGSCQAAFEPAAPRAAFPGVSVRLPGCALTVMAADERALQAVQALLDRHPLTRPALLARCGGLQLTGEVLIERRSIGCIALARLRTGDVVLTRRPCTAQPGERATLTGRSRWHGSRTMRPAAYAVRTLAAWAQVDGQHMTLDSSFDWLDDPAAAAQFPLDATAADRFGERAGESALSESGSRDTWPGRSARAGEGAPGSDEPDEIDTLPAHDEHERTTQVRLDHLELPLELTLPAPALSLAELAALTPGDTVTLPLAPEDADVRLSVHGQTIALGELVAVGGRLGVRIVRLAGALTAPHAATPDAGAAT